MAINHRRRILSRIRKNRRHQTFFYFDVRMSHHSYQHYKRFRNKELQQCSSVAEYVVLAPINKGTQS